MIYLVIALGTEAKPFIKYFKLQKDLSVNAFRLYQRDDIKLIISGSGRISAAAATAWLAAKNPSPQGIWINIGTAGHGSLEKETLFIAHKIQERASLREWYPPQIIKKSPIVTSSELITVDTVESQYETNGYDMEASAFIATAQRFSTLEFIQCLKIVSDTPSSPSHVLKADHLSEMVQKHCETIDLYLQMLKHTYKIVMQESNFAIDSILNQWHFSVTQKHQLSQLLRQWNTVQPFFSSTHPDLSSCKNAQEVLQFFRQAILSTIPAINLNV